MAVIPFGGRVAGPAVARLGNSFTTRNLFGEVGGTINGLFVAEERTLHFAAHTRAVGNTLEIADIGLFSGDLQGVATTAGNRDMLAIKDDLVSYAKERGFENLRLSWYRAGPEQFGTSAQPMSPTRRDVKADKTGSRFEFVG